MPPLKDYLTLTDQLLVDKYLKDPKGFQEIRKILEPNAKETHSQVSKERTPKAQQILRNGLRSARL